MILIRSNRTEFGVVLLPEFRKKIRRYPNMERKSTGSNRLQLACILLFFTTSSGISFSQEATGFTSGSITYKPRLGLYVVNSDNIYSTSASEVSSSIFVQEPGLLLDIRPGRHQVELEYQGEYGQYSQDSADDYADHLFAGRAFLDLGVRHGLDFDASFFKGHEDRGRGLTRGLGPGDSGFPVEPDEYSNRDLNALYSFGAKGAKGRIELSAGSQKREYDNNRATTQFYDWTRNFAGVAFYYGLRPGTYFVLDGQTRNVSYEVDRPGQATRDGDERRVRVGVTWEATGKTRGRLSVGHIRKDFDNASRPQFTGVSWEADVRWSPRTFSTFNLSTKRQPQETTGLGDFIDTRTHRVSWTHNWSDAWQSDTSYSIRNEEFVGNNRKEDLKKFNVSLLYQMRRGLGIKAGVTRESNGSDISTLDFDATVYRFGLVIAP